jgi:hypothetical protein
LEVILVVTGLAVMYLYLAVNRIVLEKYGFLAVEVHGVTTQKIVVTTVRTPNPEFFLFADMYRLFHKFSITGNLIIVFYELWFLS